MKALNSIAALIILLLDLPILAYVGGFLMLRGTRPILVRDESSPEGGFRHIRFNVEDNDSKSRHMRKTCIDLMPVLLDAVRGRRSVVECVRWMNEVGRERRRFERPPGIGETLRCVALLILAALILAVAWWPPF